MIDVLLLEGERDLGRAEFRLARLVEWAGYHISQFPRVTLSASVTEGLSWPSVVLAMGYGPADHYRINSLLGQRGYVYPTPDGRRVIPTVHPTFIQRGQSRWSAAFISDLQKAVHVAQQGLPFEVTDYLLDPTPGAAYQWAKQYLLGLQVDPRTRLAFDIETPGKGDDEEELTVGDDGHDRTWNVERIGFAYKPLHALSVPWTSEYMPAIRALMGSPGEKVVWNAGFDVPRIKHAGVAIGGLVHDAMVAWHILHSDLPKSLKFVATFTCPWQPAWKHLSGAKPAFYNATDADVELRSMEVIEAELRKNDLWEVYQRDVIDLEPILVHMSGRGMPVDPVVRLDRAIALASELARVKQELEQLVPMEARKIEHIYVKQPSDTSGCLNRRGSRRIPVCDGCGLESPRKEHFKRFVKKQNPCAGRGVREAVREVVEWYRLASFTPSRDQLIRYHQHLRRPVPMTLDVRTRERRVSFAEKQMKELILKYPLDPLYPLVLRYREIDKLAGTYVGRPIEN